MREHRIDIHSLKGFFISLVLGLMVGMALGCWLCSREHTNPTTTTKIDTTIYYRPIAIERSVLSSKTLQLPKLLFAPADTIVKTIVVTEGGNKEEVSFPIEQREYRDSTYRAIISGAVVGDRRPTLDFIETYNRNTTSEVIVEPKKIRLYIGGGIGVFGSWSVSAGGGLLIKDHHMMGIEYVRMRSENLLEIRYSHLF